MCVGGGTNWMEQLRLPSGGSAWLTHSSTKVHNQHGERTVVSRLTLPFLKSAFVFCGSSRSTLSQDLIATSYASICNNIDRLYTNIT